MHGCSQDETAIEVSQKEKDRASPGQVLLGGPVEEWPEFIFCCEPPSAASGADKSGEQKRKDEQVRLDKEREVAQKLAN